MSAWPRRVAFVGLGLMGGSLALALRRFRPEIARVGVDEDPAVRARALAEDVVEATAPLADAVARADLVVLAAPVDANLALLQRVARAAAPGAIVTDVGSTKVSICRLGRERLGERFVGGHPLSGAERGGLDGADPFLFQNALYALTPEETTCEPVKRVAALLADLGAEVVTMPPALHDDVVAHVSHLPQLLATALCALVADRAESEPLYRELAAGGFRDLTRVASSPYGTWGPILRDNRERVDAALGTLQTHIGALRRALGDNGELKARFGRAATFRETVPERAKGLLRPVHRVSVVVPDRHGALAEMLGAVAAQGINLVDVELQRIREGDGGTFHLRFHEAADAERATMVLNGVGWEAFQLK